MGSAPKMRWRRVLLVTSTALLTLSVASSCSTSTGPPDTSSSTDSTDQRDPTQPGPGDSQGYLVLPPGLNGFLA